MANQALITPPKWLEVAEGELGVAEVPGEDNNLRVLEYHKTTALKATQDSVAWCSSFVNFCLLKAGIQGTHSAAARSWLSWGKELKEPKFGCIVVLKRGNSPSQGHVGFYVGSTTPETIRVLSGNQSDKVSIQNFKKSDVLGYRWAA